MASYKFNIHDLDKGEKTYTFEFTTQWLDVALEGCDLRPVPGDQVGKATVTARKTGRDVLTYGHVKSDLLTTCSRCLGDAAIHVDVPLTTLWSPKESMPKPVQGEVELQEDEDFTREFFIGDFIEVDDVLREHLILEVPIAPLCREDCPGVAFQAMGLPESVQNNLAADEKGLTRLGSQLKQILSEKNVVKSKKE